MVILPTRILALDQQSGVMTFSNKVAGRVSGITIAEKLLHKLSLYVESHVSDAMDIDAGTVLLTAYGPAPMLHQGWKVVQNVLEWCCGVALYMAEMVTIAHVKVFLALKHYLFRL